MDLFVAGPAERDDELTFELLAVVAQADPAFAVSTLRHQMMSRHLRLAFAKRAFPLHGGALFPGSGAAASPLPQRTLG